MKAYLQSLLRESLDQVLAEAGGKLAAAPVIQIDAAKDTKHGDFATNLALTLAKPLGKPPRVVAEALVRHLPASVRVAKVEIAGPGFINFFLVADAFQAVIPQILSAKESYGHDGNGKKGKILVEFVSANPTGPMHVGHGRNAAYGDSLANILAAAGWDVSREYYINDAGRQADILAVSVWLRYLELCGEKPMFPANGYPGDYIRKTAEVLHSRVGTKLCRPAVEIAFGLPPDEAEGGDKEAYIDALIARAKDLLDAGYQTVQDCGLEQQLTDIRQTLDMFGVRFDRWYSERDLLNNGKAAEAIRRLKTAGHVYEKEGAQWLRTTAFGDEKDRVLFKADGTATYFCNDLAYHVDKLDRGYPYLLDVWGADHHGYIARVRAAIEALTGHKDALNVQLIQFVTLSSGRMGKRSGNFVTLKDLVSEAGKDATRFFYLLRSHDQHLEFDIELARSQSNDNPVYYVQYGHARICSVFRQAQERGIAFDPTAENSLHRLSETHEKALLTLLTRYPEVVRNAAETFEPHGITFYLRELADAFHSYYNAHAFLVDDAELRNARLALVSATGHVLRNGLGLLGVTAPEKM